jgi:hypothetical protein
MKKHTNRFLLFLLFIATWLTACFVSGSDSQQMEQIDNLEVKQNTSTITTEKELYSSDQIEGDQIEDNSGNQEKSETHPSDNAEEEISSELPPSSKPKIQPPKKPMRPSISFKETTKEFDEITAGDIIDVRFDFKNLGNAPLVVKSATATCGCTVPSYPFIPIEPGEEGFIGVTYNSVGKSGEQKASITLITNANPSKYVLHLKGNVLDKKEN